MIFIKIFVKEGAEGALPFPSTKVKGKEENKQTAKQPNKF